MNADGGIRLDVTINFHIPRLVTPVSAFPPSMDNPPNPAPGFGYPLAPSPNANAPYTAFTVGVVPPPNYGSPQPAYGMPPAPGYGMPPAPGYGAPGAGYGYNAPHAVPPPSYGAPGAVPPPSYGAPYAVPPPSYGAPGAVPPPPGAPFGKTV